MSRRKRAVSSVRRISRLEWAHMIFDAGSAAYAHGKLSPGDDPRSGTRWFSDFYVSLTHYEPFSMMSIWPVGVGPAADYAPNGWPIARGKVFSCHRLASSDLRILSFKRGAWEYRLLKAVGNSSGAALALSRVNARLVA